MDRSTCIERNGEEYHDIENYEEVICCDVKFSHADHLELFVEYLGSVRRKSSNTDVFLYAALGNTLSDSLFAHKQVLAAASPFLAELLQQTGEADANIFFSDFTYNQLKLLIDYIYTGEVQASKALMEEFEACLKELGIIGTHCSYGEPFYDQPMAGSSTISAKKSSTRVNPVVTEYTKKLKRVTRRNISVRAAQDQSKVTCSKGVKQNKLSSKNESEDGEHISDKHSSDEDGIMNGLQDGNSICNECGEKCSTKKELKSHAKIHDLNSGFVCQVCQKSFRHLNVLKTHLRTHTGEKPFSCSICQRSFAHKSTLNEHMNLHSDEPGPYMCTVCKRRFKQRKGLRAHRCGDDSQEEVYQCERCGRNFINRKALALHRIHHDSDKEVKEKNLLCDICGRGFSNKYLLKAHQTTHVSSEEKNFVCTVCNKKFAHKKTLQVHESSHTGDKGPYRCSYCSKTFRYVANLDAHERIHTGHKPFECDLCDAAFRQNSALKEHMLTHQKGGNVPTFVCDVCDRSFDSRRQFVAHRYSHKNQTLRCPVCKKRFYNSERLSSHIALHENVDTLPKSVISTVTAHMNEDGELIITQDVSDLGDGTILLAPSLLNAIQSADDGGDGIVEEGNPDCQSDNNKQWSFEVVIDPPS